MNILGYVKFLKLRWTTLYLFIITFYIYIYIVIIDEQVVVYQQQQQKSINIIFGRNHLVLTHKCTWNVHNVDANIPPWLYVHLQT